MNGMNVYPSPYAVYSSGKRAFLSYEELKEKIKSGEVSKTIGTHLTPCLI